MSHPSKAKGDRAELECAALLTDLVGTPIRRKLGAGRSDDTGDLDGLAGWTLEVKNYANIATGITQGLADSEREQGNAGTPFGAALIRRRGGHWFAAMTLDQFAAVVRAVTP